MEKKKVLILCPQGAVGSARRLVDSKDREKDYTMVNVSLFGPNPKEFFERLKKSFAKYDHVVVLVNEEIFKIYHLRKAIELLSEGRAGIFIRIDGFNTPPSWFRADLLKESQGLVKSDLYIVREQKLLSHSF